LADESSKRLEAKVSAILAIMVDRYLRETGVARPKVRSIDRMLTDVGLEAKDIAALLGKTERAVYLQLQAESKRKPPRKKRSEEKDEGD
jgi:hypothetical protein